MAVHADVFVDKPIAAAEVDRIAAQFAAIGLTTDLRVAAPRRSLEDVTLVILAALPFQPFVSQLATDFADDAYARLKAFATNVLHRKKPADAGAEAPKDVLVLQDTATGVRVVLEPDLPAESYRQLLSLDLTKFAQGPVHYDLARKRWRSELDEQT